ncbi:MAG: DNA-protecting protein DprA [Acidobacteria bacterium]|nr:MAG: DNA-protecting protein DprA [Acidobacteriota bacterium]
MGKCGMISRLGLLMAGGGAKVRRIVAEAGDPAEDLADVLDGKVPKAILDAARMTQESAVPQLLERVSRAGWRWMSSEAPDYPGGLNHTADPPLGLFVKGLLGGGPSVAIVGSRRATPYGIQASRFLAESVGRAGGTIISGMARGVDAAAHEGALSVGGTTWAVWGCGPDRIYPPEHARLADQIAETGALLTEYLPGSPPRRHHFPERNRIVAGLASIVVVVEAAARSGALSTARQALDEGRDVMAVPGSIFSEVSVGPNGLLRAGAQPVTCPKDLLDALGLEADSMPNIDPEVMFLEFGEAVSVDQLGERMGQSVDLVQAKIVEMEIQGLVERGPDGLIRRRR